MRVFSARAEAPAHVFVSGGKVRLEQVEEFIRELARRYRVREVAYDPRYFARSAEILEEAGLTMVEFLQASGPMADAYQAFYQEALEGSPTTATRSSPTTSRRPRPTRASAAGRCAS